MWHDRRVKTDTGRLKVTPTPPFCDANHDVGPVWYRRLAPVLHHLLEGGVKRDWDDFPALPMEGPAIIVANHLTSLDGLVLADYVLYHGRFPYFLGKAPLFKVVGLGRLLRSIEQIPVHRGTDHAAGALVEARSKVDDGKVVFIFPEGTTCRDPELWPIAAKTGAARLAIETGAPVLPLGQWGTSTICPDNAGPQTRPHLVPRHWVHIRSGEPIDMSAYGRDPEDREAVRAASAAIIAAIVPLVEQARGETAPPLRWNPRTQSYVPPDQAVW